VNPKSAVRYFAVMVGLNLCHELQQAQSITSDKAVPTEALEPLLARLEQALDANA